MGKLAVQPKIDLAFKKIFSENENLLKSCRRIYPINSAGSI